MPLTCETRRSWMPVRVVIHSSSVSMIVARSALDRTAGGMHLPQPVMAAYCIDDSSVAAVAVRSPPAGLF